MRIVTVRRASQVFFLLLFFWFCAVTVLGTSWSQLRGWPVNAFLQVDPLAALGTLVSTRTLYRGLVWAAGTVVLTIILGRFFCGWVCPFGTLHHAMGWARRRGKALPERIQLNRPRPAQSLKYYILLFLLAAAAGSLIAHVTMTTCCRRLVPWVVVAACLLVSVLLVAVRSFGAHRRAVAVFLLLVALWTALGIYFPLENLLAGSLQTGLLDPIALMQRSVNLALLPLFDRLGQQLAAPPRHYDGAGLIGAVFLATLALNLVVPRFYCRFLCPLGALLGLFGRLAPWRIGKTRDECTMCLNCEADCEGACRPSAHFRHSECVLCMNCLRTCDEKVITFRAARSASAEAPSPDLTRRGFIVSLASGLVTIPMIRLSDALGLNWNPRLLRPPGALAEDDFLKRCIKCGQCMRICPTNIIQPAGLEGGAEGVWTPVLNFRIGTSGCQLNCVACGQLCPTAALRPLTLDEKLGRNQYAAAGPIRLGTAFVDQGRCLPWSMDRPCIVCQENCPVSPKAIYVREVFNPIRDGLPPIAKADELTLDFGRAALAPGRFATGDYVCTVSDEPDGRPRRIVDNTATTLTIDSNEPWDPPPQPGTGAEILIRLQRPVVDPQLCIGCGICEHVCPVGGLRAVRVTAENESRHPKRSMLL